MKKVLSIGCYNKEGRFTSSNWKTFFEFIKSRAKKIEIIVTHSNDKIKRFINITKIPDTDLQIYTIEVNEQNMEMLVKFNYNIDSSGIEYLFFYDSNGEIAYINITDYENYIVIDEKTDINALISKLISIDDNILDCNEHWYDIDSLTEDNWTPLGL